MWVAQTVWAGLALWGVGRLVLLAIPHSLSRLESAVVALAIGRVVLGAFALVTAGTPALGALFLPFAVALIGALGWGVRRGVLQGVLQRVRQGTLLLPWPRSVLPWVVILLGLGFWVVQVVVGRSGVEDAAGALVFHGQHTTNDPLTYLAMAWRITELGWPVESPFVAGIPNLGHALWFGEIVGIQAITGAERMDVVFRIRPHLDMASLSLSVFAVSRALGAGVTGAGLAGLLLLLGGGLSQALLLGALALGFEVGLHEVWGFGTAFHLPFNSIAPALQTAFAALLILARPSSTSRGAALLAGVLLACVFEIKLFLWPALLGGLLLAIPLARGPARASLVWAGAAAALVSLPLLVQKLLFAAQLDGLASVGFEPCLGCLPAYVFATTRPATLAGAEYFEAALSVERLLVALPLSLAYVAVLLGVKLVAVPALWRGAREPGPVQPVHLVLGLAAILGLGAACVIGTPPHPVNAAQFVWIGSLGLWPLIGLPLGGWIARRRWLPVAAVVGLALPSGLFFIVAQGAAAPPFVRVEPAERQLLRTLEVRAAPLDRVLEPSLLQGDSRLSRVAWLAGKPVYASHRAHAGFLGPDESAARVATTRRAFESTDPRGVVEAVRKSGAVWVYAPADRPLRVDPRPHLELSIANEAGSLWRVPDPTDARVLGSQP